MLATSKLIDLLTGKLSDQVAFEYLVEISSEKPSAAFINELVTTILALNSPSSFEQFNKSNKLIDCCGTGGSGIPHYNTSTSVAFVLAAGGLTVAKFGNRSASGTSGSFDFLEYLGVPTVSSQKDLLEIMQKTHLCFLFAPQFYPGLVKLAPLRKALGKPTVFNLIGPLLNPLCPTFRILGTAKEDAQIAIADYLFHYKLCTKALVVRSESGLDELDPAAKNVIFDIEEKLIKESKLLMPSEGLPQSLREQTAIKRTSAQSIAMTPKENALLFHQLISNFACAPPYFRTLLTLNAGAGFFVAGMSNSIEEGQELASDLLLSGAVLEKYDQCRSLYAKYS